MAFPILVSNLMSMVMYFHIFRLMRVNNLCVISRDNFFRRIFRLIACRIFYMFFVYIGCHLVLFIILLDFSNCMTPNGAAFVLWHKFKELQVGDHWWA